jgi:hypothetical protein
VVALQRSLQNSGEHFWQSLLRDGVYVYTAESLVISPHILPFRERCGGPSLWNDADVAGFFPVSAWRARNRPISTLR